MGSKVPGYIAESGTVLLLSVGRRNEHIADVSCRFVFSHLPAGRKNRFDPFFWELDIDQRVFGEQASFIQESTRFFDKVGRKGRVQEHEVERARLCFAQV